MLQVNNECDMIFKLEKTSKLSHCNNWEITLIDMQVLLFTRD